MKFINNLVEAWYTVSYIRKKKLTYKRVREICDLIDRYNLTPMEADNAFALDRLVRYSKLYNSMHGTFKLMVDTFRLPIS